MGQSIPADPLAIESWESGSAKKSKGISCVHFRTSENNHGVLSKLIGLHSFPIHKTSPKFSCEIKILVENGAPFVLLKTNLTGGIIKLLVDTGAAATLIASDIILDSINVAEFKLNLFGLPGRDAMISTGGLVQGFAEIGEGKAGIAMHLIERKYAGPADGYLGFDFIRQHKSKIDMESQMLTCNIINKDNFNIQRRIKYIERPHDTRKINGETRGVKNETGESGNLDKNIFHSKIDMNNAIKITKKTSKRNKFNEFVEASKYYEDNISKNKIFIGNFITPIPMKAVNLVVNDIPNDIERGGVTLKMGNSENKFQNCTKNINTIAPTHSEEKCLITKYKETEWTNERAKNVYESLKLDHCSEKQKKHIRKLCENFPKVFYVEGDNLSCTKIVKHYIKLKPDAKPKYVRQYKVTKTT